MASFRVHIKITECEVNLSTSFKVLPKFPQEAETQEREASIQFDMTPAEDYPLFQIVSRCSVL